MGFRISVGDLKVEQKMPQQSEWQEEGAYLCGLRSSVVLLASPRSSPVIKRGETATQPRCSIRLHQCDCDSSKYLRLFQSGKNVAIPSTKVAGWHVRWRQFKSTNAYLTDD
ncbi:hypothetical protein ABZX51_006879 [Aspergillus tubingensis]